MLTNISVAVDVKVDLLFIIGFVLGRKKLKRDVKRLKAWSLVTLMEDVSVIKLYLSK